MKKIFMSDNALKVISVIIAIGIWIYISIVMDPAIEITVRDLPIQFTGVESLDRKNLAVISESKTSVTVKIKGSRRKMGNNSMKSIIVNADLSSIDKEGMQTIPISITVPFENQGITSQSDYMVDVNIEPAIEKEYKIDVKTDGKLAENYMSDAITVSPDTIKIRGAKSAVEKIEKAEVNLSYDNEDVDIDKTLPVTIYEAGDKEINDVDPIQKRIRYSQRYVNVHCSVGKIKTIKISPNFGSRGLPEGYEWSAEPAEVYVYGNDMNEEKLTEIKTEQINTERLVENDKIKVKLIIPDGIKTIGDVSEVEISVKKK